MKPARLLARILDGQAANVTFNDVVRLLEALGFTEVAGKGSHRVHARPDIPELVNIQNDHGQAKPYQVRQLAALARRYALSLEDDT